VHAFGACTPPGTGPADTEDISMTDTTAPAAPTAILKLPGGFADWFEGTGVAQGQDDGDAGCAAARLAFQSAPRRPAGGSYYLEVTASAPVLELFAEYAGYCLDANNPHTSEPVAREVSGARAVQQRVEAALEQLGIGD
jgi:hypothetical protein